MGRLIRLDAELVRRSLAPSRTRAQTLVEAGLVKVDGQVCTKSARQVDKAQAIVVAEDAQDAYASRGGHKLAGALDYLGECTPRVEGALCLDAGASTGGFTDVLLRRGAQHVVAADVGYGQLAWQLQSDERVTVMDRTNVRLLQPQQLPYRPELTVSDLSFISLTLVLPALHRCSDPAGQMLLMVKPQFEVGRENLGAGGVVRDTQLHQQAVLKVARCAQSLGMGVLAAAPSPLPGPAGNVEYFLHLGMEPGDGDVQAMVAKAVAEGPAGGRHA